jgi:hypothetical protein
MIAGSVVAVALLAWPGALAAHHSLVQFDRTTPVWVKGTVVRFDRVNPHSLIFIDQTSADGQIQRWAVDGPAPNALARMGVAEDVLKAGDVIEICGSVMKEEFERARQKSSTSFISGRPISGHLLVMPDGRRRVWSDYGVLEKCLNPGEDKEQLRRESFGR